MKKGYYFVDPMISRAECSARSRCTDMFSHELQTNEEDHNYSKAEKMHFSYQINGAICNRGCHPKISPN